MRVIRQGLEALAFFTILAAVVIIGGTEYCTEELFAKQFGVGLIILGIAGVLMLISQALRLWEGGEEE